MASCSKTIIALTLTLGMSSTVVFIMYQPKPGGKLHILKTVCCTT